MKCLLYFVDSRENFCFILFIQGDFSSEQIEFLLYLVESRKCFER